ncbi:hypothetical protein B0H14DRAFT_2584903 [Mycena olivaceomarginata]|nr:hypothetical protein B0H14DRAFT_2584903 [Mycena olivaceomarginata]
MTQFFSSEGPDFGDQALRLRMRRLPIPDSKTINQLLTSCRQAWLDGAQSVIYSNLGGSVVHFPLWILTYWAMDDIKEIPNQLLLFNLIGNLCQNLPTGAKDNITQNQSEALRVASCLLKMQWITIYPNDREFTSTAAASAAYEAPESEKTD